MKLVPLPGMDGTGRLFEEILHELGAIDVITMSLPNHGAQDYESLSRYVADRLPTEDIVLLAESFSGGVAARLSTKNIQNIKGIIFVASFLSSPKRFLPFFALALPIRLLASMPLSALLHRWLFLGCSANTELVKNFVGVVKSVPNQTLRARLLTIGKSRYCGFGSDIPTFYIGASNDKLVGVGKRDEFKKAYSQIEFRDLDGPHFLLQSRPRAGAKAIVEAVRLLTIKTN